jgi:ribosomal protein S18 acetylase RimI-like enzyme
VDAVDVRGGFDLLRMLRLTQQAWHPTARWHVGDLAWERRFHPGPSARWPTRIWLDADNAPMGWGWLTAPGELAFVVHRDDDAAIVLEVVDWAISASGDATPLTTTVTLGQTELRATLESRGFVATPAPGMHHLACDPRDVVQPAAPPGFIVRTLRSGEEELVARAEVHIAAWESSTMRTDVYRALQRIWPYRRDLDVVAEVIGESQDHPRFASSCLAWLDELHGVGELEPVGTDPQFRRRGLAAATCAEAVRRLAEAGATTAIVYASADPEYPAPLSLYRSLGFEPVTRTVDLRRG